MTDPQAGGRITTHVLDTASGRPAAGMLVTLERLPGRERLGQWRTDADGRCGAPLLQGAALVVGEYEISFDVAGWRAGSGQPGFYDSVPIRFRVTDPNAHHHVPLILSPFGYATYRGS